MLTSKEIHKRNRQIYKKRLTGMALPAIGREYSISAERVRQIVNKMKHEVGKRDLKN